jgi:hypothetical protein
MRNVTVADRSWNIDENGDDMTADSQGRQSGANDPVTNALLQYGYARI